MSNWPSELPQSMLIDSYSEQAQDGRIRTSMDAGPDFVRRRFSAVSTRHSGSMILTTSQMTSLQTFFNSTLSGGTSTFAWHPRGLHDASPQVTLTMRFLSPPSYRYLGNDRYQADLSLESLP